MDQAEPESQDQPEDQDRLLQSFREFRRFITSVVVIFSMVFITFGLYVYFTRANDQRQQEKLDNTVKQLELAQNEVVQTRNESRRIQCYAENEFKTAHNAGFQHVVDIFQSIADKTLNPQVQADAKAQLEIFKSDLVTLRDCSPQGIDAYYKENN